MVVLAPWVVYNAGRFDQTFLISTNDGLTLVGANCDSQYDGPDPGLWDIACLPEGSFTDAQQPRSVRGQRRLSPRRGRVRAGQHR